MRARHVLAPLAAVLATSACSGEDGAPSHLLDGADARPPPVGLRGVDGPVIVARSHAAPDSALGPARATCLAFAGLMPTSGGADVLRVGARGASVTLRRGAGLYACDAGSRADETGWRWCGTSSGRLQDGRLRDPRLDLLCETESGSPLAFAWARPLPAARYVVVHEAGYAEVHAVVGGRPVRVATTRDVDLGEAHASFDVSEHDARGRLLRRYRLVAAVAG